MRWACMFAAAAAAGVATGFEGVVNSRCGSWRGADTGDDVWAFRGIRYAKMPQRFEPAEEAACDNSTVMNAYECGSMCVQRNVMGVLRAPLRWASGACLLLSLLVNVACARCCAGSRISPASASQPLLSDEKPGQSKGQCRWLTTLMMLCIACACFFAAESAAVGPVQGDEDCLYLNVFSPQWALDTQGRLPVMFFIHGGDTTGGSGCDSFLGSPSKFVAGGNVTAVNINYRLSIFGFLSIADAEGSSLFENSANVGVRDIVEALKWTQTNIAAFGGNPDKVMIYGESSGGTLVYAVLASPLAQGLYHRALSMSGSSMISATPAEASAEWHRSMVPNLHCKEQDLRSCMQNLDAYKLFQSIDPDALDPKDDLGMKSSSGPRTGEIFLEIVDGKVIPESPLKALSASAPQLRDIPLIVGSMREEFDLGWPLVSPNAFWPMTKPVSENWAAKVAPGNQKFLADVWAEFKPTEQNPERQSWTQLSSDITMVCPNLEMAKIASRRSSDALVYSYIFTYAPSSTFHFLGVPVDLKYAFHAWDLLLLWQAKFPGLDYSFAPSDLEVSKRFQLDLAMFAETGRLQAPWESVNDTTPYCLIGQNGVSCEDRTTISQCRVLSEGGLDIRHNISMIN